MDDNLFIVKQMEKKIKGLSEKNDSCIESLITNFVNHSKYNGLDFISDNENCKNIQNELNKLMKEYDNLLRSNVKLC